VVDSARTEHPRHAAEPAAVAPTSLRRRAAIAAALGLVVSEIVLRLAGVPKKHDLEHACDTRMAGPDARAGWVWNASAEQTTTQGWRPITYAFDTEHDRAAAAGGTPDHEAPSILFVGESIMAGHGLRWQESLPALVAGALGVQAVNLGVDGYASDQAFVRLVDALPRYAHVVAVVTLFFPGLVDRVAWVDHPRVSFEGDAVRVAPANPGFWGDMRLVRAAREAWPGHDAAAVQLTGRIFRETDRMAASRGARSLVLVTHEGARLSPEDRRLVDTLLVAPGLETVEHGYEPIRGDGHPNPASTREMADAVIDALRQPRRPRTR
jgi:hypothetical protein